MKANSHRLLNLVENKGPGLRQKTSKLLPHQRILSFLSHNLGSVLNIQQLDYKQMILNIEWNIRSNRRKFPTPKIKIKTIEYATVNMLHLSQMRQIPAVCLVCWSNWQCQHICKGMFIDCWVLNTMWNHASYHGARVGRRQEFSRGGGAKILRWRFLQILCCSTALKNFNLYN